MLTPAMTKNRNITNAPLNSDKQDILNKDTILFVSRIQTFFIFMRILLVALLCIVLYHVLINLVFAIFAILIISCLLFFIKPTTIAITNKNLIVIKNGLIGPLDKREYIELTSINSIEPRKGHIVWFASILVGSPFICPNKLCLFHKTGDDLEIEIDSPFSDLITLNKVFVREKQRRY